MRDPVKGMGRVAFGVASALFHFRREGGLFEVSWESMVRFATAADEAAMCRCTRSMCIASIRMSRVELPLGYLVSRMMLCTEFDRTHPSLDVEFRIQVDRIQTFLP